MSDRSPTTQRLNDVVEAYLDQLRRALAPMAPARRELLVGEIAGHIASARADLADESEAGLRNLLERVGPPEVIAEAALDADPTDAASAPAASGSSVPSPGPGGPGPKGAAVPTKAGRTWWPLHRRLVAVAVVVAALVVGGIAYGFLAAGSTPRKHQASNVNGHTAGAGSTASVAPDPGPLGRPATSTTSVPPTAGSGGGGSSGGPTPATTAPGAAPGVTSTTQPGSAGPLAWVLGRSPDELVPVRVGSGTTGAPVVLPPEPTSPSRVFMSPGGGTGYVAIGNSVLTFNTISGVLGPTIAGDPSNTTGNAHWTVDQENGNLVAIGQSGQLAWLAPSTPGARWRDLASVPYGLPVVIGSTAYDVASVPVGSVSTTPPQTAPTCPIGNCASTPLEDVVIPISLATGTVGPAAVLGTAGHGTPPVILGAAQVQGSILIHTDPGDFLYQPGPHHVAQIAGSAAANSTTVGPNSVATSTGAEGWIAVGSNLVQPVIPDYLTYGTPASTNFPVDGVAVTRSGTRVLLFGSSKTAAVLSAGTGTVSTHFTMPALDYVSAAFLTNP